MKQKIISSFVGLLLVATSLHAKSNAPANYYYSQSSGVLSGGRGAGPILTKGYSGRNQGLNNPSAQAIRNTGPIPRGTYNATGVTNSKGPNTIVLRPGTGTNTQGRDAFRIHGDNRAGNRSASQGCIIARPEVRQVIRNQVNSGRQVQIHVGR